MMTSSCQWFAMVPRFELFQLCTKDNLLDLLLLVKLHPFLVASGLVVLALSPWLHPGRSTSIRTSESLQALLTIVAPTRSIWPSNYTHLARRASTLRSKTIQLPLSDICSDISAGRIEFRNPVNDLSDLFHEPLCVYGWLIQFRIGIPFWMNVLRWIIISYLPSFKPVPSVTDLSLSSKTRFPSARDASHKPYCNATKLVKFLGSPEDLGSSCSCSFASPVVSMAVPILCLDFIPYAHLEPFIRALKASWCDDSSAMLEFTTLGSSISFLSTPFVLCTIPFLPRKYSQPQQNQLVLTSNPLLISLHHVINLVMSGSTPLTVKTVSNISETYATKLNAALKELETDRRVRNMFIDQWGVKGWREHRFLLAWEAALLKVGYLTRWTVVVG